MFAVLTTMLLITVKVSIKNKIETGSWFVEEYIPQKAGPIFEVHFLFLLDQGLLDLDGRNSKKYLHQT